MNDNPINRTELITGLDACRPGSDDLRQPELRAVAEQVASDRSAESIHVRIERIDLAMSRAMHDVSLPEGFANRLLARLGEAGQSAASGDTFGSGVLPAPVIAAPTSQGATSSTRRRWLVWSAGLAVTAAAVLIGVIILRPVKPLNEGDLESSRQWHDAIAASQDWQVLEPRELDAHQLPSELLVAPLRYQDASAIVGREAWAYDVSLAGGPSATLFIIPQSDRAGVASAPPIVPQSFTLGSSVAYWQSGDVVYVLVIESDRREAYRMLLRTARPQAA